MTAFNTFRHETDVETFAAGSTIFAAGTPAACMYAIKSGQVEIVRDRDVIEQLGPGEVFGEMALIDGAPRSATARAVAHCELVPIDERHFNFLVQQTPGFALNMLRASTTGRTTGRGEG